MRETANALSAPQKDRPTKRRQTAFRGDRQRTLCALPGRRGGMRRSEIPRPLLRDRGIQTCQKTSGRKREGRALLIRPSVAAHHPLRPQSIRGGGCMSGGFAVPARRHAAVGNPPAVLRDRGIQTCQKTSGRKREGRALLIRPSVAAHQSAPPAKHPRGRMHARRIRRSCAAACGGRKSPGCLSATGGCSCRGSLSRRTPACRFRRRCRSPRGSG